MAITFSIGTPVVGIIMYALMIIEKVGFNRNGLQNYNSLLTCLYSFYRKPCLGKRITVLVVV